MFTDPINLILPTRPALAAALRMAINDPRAPGIIITGRPSIAVTALMRTLALIAGQEDGAQPTDLLPVLALGVAGPRTSELVDVLGDMFHVAEGDVELKAVVNYLRPDVDGQPIVSELPLTIVHSDSEPSVIARALHLDASDAVLKNIETVFELDYAARLAA